MCDAGAGWCAECRGPEASRRRRRRCREGTRASDTRLKVYAAHVDVTDIPYNSANPATIGVNTPLHQSRLETRGTTPGAQSGLEIGIGRRARRPYRFPEIPLSPAALPP